MMKRQAKGVIALFMAVLTAAGMSATAFAQESAETAPKYLPSDVEEITEEIIEEYGILSTDADGSEVITILFEPSREGTSTPVPKDGAEDDVHGAAVPDDMVSPQHSPYAIPHTHEVINLSSYKARTFEPVTEWAGAGLTVTKEYARAVTINSSFSLGGGISVETVEAALGISVGRSYKDGEYETYAKTVPDGYKGRLVYHYEYTVYNFTNKTTYYLEDNPVVETIETYDECYVYGPPEEGMFALQLRVLNLSTVNVPRTDWQKIDNKWYYILEDGSLVTGWLKVEGKWYYLDEAQGGAMVTGWKKLDGKWYYFASNGAMQTGWQRVSGKWYYLAAGGAMKTGWLKDNGKWYYLESDGAMVSGGAHRIDGKIYFFDASGVCLNP